MLVFEIAIGFVFVEFLVGFKELPF
jgi:hypothetical protein